MPQEKTLPAELMAHAQDWLANLEHGLNSWLDDWLEQNPRQRELLGEEKVVETGGSQHQIRHEARRLRQVLLGQAQEIQRWKQRCNRVATMRSHPGKVDLAGLCRSHLDRCHGDGSTMWERLEQLGRMRTDPTMNARHEPQRWEVTKAPAALLDAWRRFELDLELEQLKRGGTARG